MKPGDEALGDLQLREVSGTRVGGRSGSVGALDIPTARPAEASGPLWNRV